MAGGSLPEFFENYTPQTSFTENGELKTESLLQTDLVDFSSFVGNNTRNDLSESTSMSNKPIVSTNIFHKSGPIYGTSNYKESEGNSYFSQTPLFPAKETVQSSKNVFTSTQQSVFPTTFENTQQYKQNFQKNIFSTSRNIFDSYGENQFTKNIFGNQTLNNNSKNIFRTEQIFPSFNISANTDEKQIQKNSQVCLPSSNLFGINSKDVNTNLPLKTEIVPDAPKISDVQEKNEILEREKSDAPRTTNEQEDLEGKEGNPKAEIFSENKRSIEENINKEIERKKKEEEERLRKEELLRLEREEKIRQEERARLEQLRLANAQLKKIEERKRKIEIEYKQKIDRKMSDLKNKYQKWKTKIVFEKWRIKTWSAIEEQKMKDYLREVKIKYPPVCSEELLDGNPYGLVIPNSLTLEKFRDWNKELNEIAPKKLILMSDDLPLLKVNSILGKTLKDRAKSLGNKLNVFPWKLVISVPDEIESAQYWKSIETFVEMHFVENFSWKFGVQNGPLYCRSGCYGSFQFKISIRRLRGCEMYEGSEPNYLATIGTNALIFVMTDGSNEITCKRLKRILHSRGPLPKIPLVIFFCNNNLKRSDIEKELDLDRLKETYITDYFIFHGVSDRQQLVHQLIKCLNVAVCHSAPPPYLRINSLSAFISGSWFDDLWRRIEISLSNFKFNLEDPKGLINFFNSCIDKLLEVFLMNSEEYTVLGEEFSEFGVKPPKKTLYYHEKLNSFLQILKLPPWPVEIPKSCHQLNYRIHQYCKKICNQDKQQTKNLKWLLYQIIRKSLLWKGLDIYCDEDINEILINFPWIQVFKEISKNLVCQANKKIEFEKEFLVIYNIEKLEEFTFETTLLGKFFTNSRKRSLKKLDHLFEEKDSDIMRPSIEKDSVLYAYSVAIEKDSIKRKREEWIDDSVDVLFSSPFGKRMDFGEEENKRYDFSEIKCSFQNLDDELDRIKKQMAENSKMMLDVQNKMQ